MTTAAPLITVDKVNKHFGPHHVLKDVSTHFNAGEVAVIIGASGSGKSTLLRMLNRLERHDSGRIVVDGIEVSDDAKQLDRLRTEVGMVFQQFNLFPHLTVLDNVALAPLWEVRQHEAGAPSPLRPDQQVPWHASRSAKAPPPCSPRLQTGSSWARRQRVRGSGSWVPFWARLALQTRWGRQGRRPGQ